jgi:ElaA protein
MTIPASQTKPRISPTARPRIDVERVTTPAQQAAMIEIRRRVFGEEQRTRDSRASDPDDARSLIGLACIRPLQDQHGAPRPVATGRLTPASAGYGPALIAWVATVPEARGLGAGSAVMRFLLDAADDAGIDQVVLAAQVHAEGFYRRFGFVRAGPLYDVRGIAHRRMVRCRPL